LAQDAPRIETIASGSAERALGALESDLGDLAERDVGVYVHSAIEGEGGARLADAWRRVLTREIGRRARAVAEVHGASLDEAAAEVSRRGLDALAGVGLSVEGHHLVTTETIHRGSRGFRGVLAPRAELSARVSTRIPLDAYLRTFAGALPLLTQERVRALSGNLFGRGYLAIASIDFDRDGRDELALLTAREIEILRGFITERGFLRLRRAALIPLALRGAAQRSQRPIGTLALDANGRLVGRTSEHATGFSIERTGGEWTLSEWNECGELGFPLDDGCAQRVVGRDFFQAELTSLGGRPVPVASVSGFYHRAHAVVIGSGGDAIDMEIVVTPRGRLGSRAGELRSGIAGYGAALGLADVDQDGAPEVLTSDVTGPGEADRLHLLRLRRDAAIVSVWSSEPMPGMVLVAGAADVDGDGADELLAIEERTTAPCRLWVVR
jgi:hypothetical protein